MALRRGIWSGSLFALVVVQCAYVWWLRQDVRALSQRVQLLSAALAEREPPTTPEVARPSALDTRASQAQRGEGAPRARASDDTVHAAVVDELARQRDAQRAADEARLDEVTVGARQLLAHTLDANDVEIARLEQLGDDARDAENALAPRHLSAEELNREQLRLWNNMEIEARRMLGDARYARLEALRREHPELGRSLYLLRSPPSQLAVAERSGAAEPALRP